MARLLLAGAIIFELVATSCMKFSKGFSNLKFSIIMVAFYIASMLCGNFRCEHGLCNMVRCRDCRNDYNWS